MIMPVIIFEYGVSYLSVEAGCCSSYVPITCSLYLENC